MWLVFSLLAMCSWGLAMFFPKLASQQLSPISVLVWQMVGCSVILLTLVISNGKVEVHFPGAAYAILTGFFSITGGFLFLRALKVGNASIVLMVTALYPLITLLLFTVVLREPMQLKQGLGAILALVALVLIAT